MRLNTAKQDNKPRISKQVKLFCKLLFLNFYFIWDGAKKKDVQWPYQIREYEPTKKGCYKIWYLLTVYIYATLTNKHENAHLSEALLTGISYYPEMFHHDGI